MKAVKEDLIAALEERAAQGATLLELIERVHEAENTPRYTRGILLGCFPFALGMGPRDLHDFVFACEIFGDGATMTLEEAEARFRRFMSGPRTLPRMSESPTSTRTLEEGCRLREPGADWRDVSIVEVVTRLETLGAVMVRVRKYRENQRYLWATLSVNGVDPRAELYVFGCVSISGELAGGPWQVRALRNTGPQGGVRIACGDNALVVNASRVELEICA